MTPSDVSYFIQAIKITGRKLTAWEEKFLSDIKGKQKITFAQAQVIEKIYAKVTGGSRYERHQYVGRR